MAEMILDRVADWPPEAQAELLKFIIDTEVKHFGTYRLSDEERAAVREGLAQADRGEFAPDEVTAEFFKRYGR
jgi:predicted transcriptional regulator